MIGTPSASSLHLRAGTTKSGCQARFSRLRMFGPIAPPGIAALACVAAIALTTCSFGASSGSGTSPSGKTIVWGGCGQGFAGSQCGYVPVPLDYSHPNAATIKIALLRKSATDPGKRIGSLLINYGGPGESGITDLQSDRSLSNLNRRFDLIGFDPRGIGRSAPVHCLDGAQEDAFNAIDPVLDDPEEKQAAIAAYKTFAAGCQKLTGPKLSFMDTVSAARDLDVIRAALGDAKLTYLGFSYGTFLGETYAHLFPTHVRALSLDAVWDPELSANDAVLAQVVATDRTLVAYFANCNARSTCPYADAADARAKLTALMSRLDANPMPVGPRMLTRSLAMSGVTLGVIFSSSWPDLDRALAQAEAGDGSLLLQAADFAYGRNPDGSYSNGADAGAAIRCLDRPVPTEIAAYDQLGAAMIQASPLFGPVRQYFNLLCSYWPVPATGEVGPLTATGAPPILLVGGTDDPATPYAWAQSVNKQLAGSVLLTRQGYGHMSYFQSSCVQAAEDSYLIDLEVPARGAVCASD